MITNILSSKIALFIALTILVTSYVCTSDSASSGAAESMVYVSITGNDTTGDGTIGNPYRTLYFASKKLAQSSSLIIGGGVYGYDDCLLLTRSGTPENPIIIEPVTGETVTVTGNGKYGTTLYAAGNSSIIISNINFYAVSVGVSVTGADNLTIEGCSFVNLANTSSMVFIDCTRCKVLNNYFDTNGGDLLGSGAGDALSIIGCSNMLIQNNYFTKNGHYAIMVSISPGTPNISHNNIIIQNYIDEQWGGGIDTIMVTENTVIEDNVLKRAGEQCVSYPKAAVQIASSTTILRNNLLLNSKHGLAEYQSKMAFDGDPNTCWKTPYSRTSPALNEKHWLAVDLGFVQMVDNVIINWGADYATRKDGIITNYQYYSNISRALIKCKGYTYFDEMGTTEKLNMFNDAYQISDYARTSVALCVDIGVLKGYTENYVTTFRPDNNTNRAEVAKITDMVIKLD